jgi:hypothetical protein
MMMLCFKDSIEPSCVLSIEKHEVGVFRKVGNRAIGGKEKNLKNPFMGKSQETRRKLKLTYRRLSPMAQSPPSGQRERRSSGGGSTIMAFFP